MAELAPDKEGSKWTKQIRRELFASFSHYQNGGRIESLNCLDCWSASETREGKGGFEMHNFSTSKIHIITIL